jgi:hypothetical protein
MGGSWSRRGGIAPPRPRPNGPVRVGSCRPAMTKGDRSPALGRRSCLPSGLASAWAPILATPFRGERLGQYVRNLFECLGLAEEGALHSLPCGERPDSPLR